MSSAMHGYLVSGLSLITLMTASEGRGRKIDMVQWYICYRTKVTVLSIQVCRNCSSVQNG